MWANATFWSAAKAARAALLALGLALAGGSAGAVPWSDARPGFTAEEQAALQQAEAYLAGITTLESRFQQINPDGSVATGKMYLRRPGYMRFEYDPPVPVMLISNGLWLIYVDHELKSSNYLPLDRTPAKFLVRQNASLEDGLTVTDVELGPGVVRVHVVEEGESDLGSVLLTFSERPFELRKWKILDAVGKEVELTLVDPKFGVAIDPTVFAFSDPYHDLGAPQ